MEQIIRNWKVRGYYPSVPLFGFTEESGISQPSATDEYEAQEGKSLYDILFENGVIEDPMTDANSFKCEWVANRWWVYTVELMVEGEFPRLCFEGVDGEFSVYFDNKFLGSHYNSFTELEIDMREFAGIRGILMIMVKCPEKNINQSGYTSQITTQRPRYDFKWDFCPRMISLGIVAPVKLKTGAEISEVKIIAQTCGTIKLNYIGKYFSDDCEAVFEINGIKTGSAKSEGTLTAQIKNPRLWNANGSGEAHLYKGKLSVLKGGKTVWQKEYNIGFRTVEFVLNENAPEGSLPYSLVLNGKKTYIKGVNMVPIAMSRANMTRSKYKRLITLAKEMHVNLIRVWGGGIIETDDFYNLCDESGILVWQDFMQSSSGIENCATVLEDGLRNIQDTAVAAVKRLRNHPSLAVYCGGNELMDNWVPHDYSHKNISMLKETVERYDGQRLMLPTTASGPMPNGNLDRIGKGLHHDIHGPWTFDGNEEHYKFYNNIDSQLHSEFGCAGFCNREVFDKIFSEKEKNLADINSDYIWRHKAEWWNIAPVLESIFGKAQSVNELLSLGQFMQAEGVRYAVEANRRRAFENSGSILWQLNEPYPNLSCTNLVDYFGNPKPVYFAAKQAFAPVNVSLKYDKLAYASGEKFKAEVWLTSDIEGVFDCETSVSTASGSKTHIFRARIASCGKSVKAGEIELEVPCSGAMEFKLGVINDLGVNVQKNVLLAVREGEYCDSKYVIDYMQREYGSLGKPQNYSAFQAQRSDRDICRKII